MSSYRIEKDLIGEVNIDEKQYWGIHTQRALNNFVITGYTVPEELIKALAIVKKACALTNAELGFLDKNKAEAITNACDDICAGNLKNEFPIDALQAGAGTSTNMNINEVIANRAIEILKGTKGDYTKIHPIEDVNLHQSTNDVYPTAVKIAAIFGLRRLSKNIEKLQGAFQKKEKLFAEIVKIGRTEMQDAVPMTLGAEFSGFAEAISRDRWRIFKCEERLRVVNIGGTAIGTGLTAPREYIFLVIEKLRALTGLGICRAENIIGATANSDEFVEVSGILKAFASNIIKISNDLRIMNMLKEISLKKLQAGSSIMPGKVNPIILEAAMQTGLKVIANDFLITEAASRASMQINEFMPLLAFSILESIKILNNISIILVDYITEISANEDICRQYVENSPTIITAFLPFIGYEKAEQLIKEFTNSSKTNIKNFLEEKLGKDIVEKILSPYSLTSLGYKINERNP